jgi:hemolysin III
MSGQSSWDYDRAEIIADGVMHAIGVCLGLIGAVTILMITVNIERIEIAPILVYVIGLGTANFAFVEPEREYGPAPIWPA